MQEVILAVRGTKALHDFLTDLCSSSHCHGGGHLHWGMLQAAEWLLASELRLLATAMQQNPGDCLGPLLFSIKSTTMKIGVRISQVDIQFIR